MEQIANLYEAALLHIYEGLPTTPLAWLVQAGGGLVVTLIFLTFFEHYIHLNMMHRRGLPGFMYKILPLLERVRYRHAVMHHNEYYKQFDFEPDPAGVDENINIRFYQTLSLAAVTVPLIAVGLYISFVATFIFMLGGYAHNKAWNIVHTQMHKPRDVWFRSTWYYRSVAFHHFLHHHHQMDNLNVVLPGADFILGKVAHARVGDIREMVRLGYIVPRSERGRRLQKTMKPKPRYTFEQEHHEVRPLAAAA